MDIIGAIKTEMFKYEKATNKRPKSLYLGYIEGKLLEEVLSYEIYFSAVRRGNDTEKDRLVFWDMSVYLVDAKSHLVCC